MKYHKLLENAKKPKGFWGKKMINSMNEGHYELTGWALDHINLERNYRVLDVGCGGGLTVSRIAERIGNGKVYGIDYSALCIKHSKAQKRKNILCNKVKIMLASVSSLPFDDCSFDVVTALETYYFWPDKLNDLKEIYRVLKPSGKLMLVFEMLKTPEEPDKWKAVEDKIGIKTVTEEEIREMLAKAGFSDIETYKKEGTTWLCAIGAKN